MLRLVRLAPVVLLFLFAGCSDNTAPVSLALNRARWEKQNLHVYNYTGRKFCYCPNGGQDVYVQVFSDTVRSARVVGTTVELPKGEWYTVDQLFDLAQSSYGQYKSVNVDYDRELGHPTRIDLVCSSNLADCDVAIEVKNLSNRFPAT